MRIKGFLGLKLRTLKNSVFPIKKDLIGKFLLVSFFGITFFFGTYFLFRKIIDYLLSYEDFTRFFVIAFSERLIAMVYLMSFTMLVMSNITTALSTLYLSDDLKLLFSFPISRMKIFASKALEGILNSSYIIVIFIIPILLAYGRAFKAETAFYLWIIPSTILFIIPPAGIGIVLTLILMRFLPAHKTYRVIMVLTLIFIVIVVFGIRMVQPERLFNPETTDDFVELVNSISIPNYEKLPSTWVARIHFGLLTDDSVMFRNALINTGMLALGSLIIIFLTARFLYYRGWTTAQKTEKVDLKVKRRFSAVPKVAQKILGRRLGALFSKDVKLFFRETSQWSQLLLLGALVVLYLYNITNIPFPHPALKNAIAFLNLGMAGFVLAAVGARFVFPSVSAEARAFWIIKSCPFNSLGFLMEKFLISFIPLLFLAEILVITSNILLEVDTFLMILSSITVFFITLALTGFGIGVGAIYPDFKAENPSKIAVSTAGIFYMLASLTYVGLILIIEARPVYMHFAKHYTQMQTFGESTVWYLIGIALSLGLAFGPLFLAVGKLDELEWS